MHIVIVGRRWFDKKNGNTYHTSEVIVDGMFVTKTYMTYGHGDQYIQTALEYLEQNNLVPPRETSPNHIREPIYQWKERHEINIYATVADVERKKDL